MRCDGVNRGANVQFLSQFPYERELLFPPCTYITCREARVQRTGPWAGVRLISMSVSVSTARPNTDGITTGKPVDTYR